MGYKMAYKTRICSHTSVPKAVRGLNNLLISPIFHLKTLFSSIFSTHHLFILVYFSSPLLFYYFLLHIVSSFFIYLSYFSPFLFYNSLSLYILLILLYFVFLSQIYIFLSSLNIYFILFFFPRAPKKKQAKKKGVERSRANDLSMTERFISQNNTCVQILMNKKIYLSKCALWIKACIHYASCVWLFACI